MPIHPAGHDSTRLGAATAQPAIEAGHHSLPLRVADWNLGDGWHGRQEDQKKDTHGGSLRGNCFTNEKGPTVSRGAFQATQPAAALLHADGLAAALAIPHIERNLLALGEVGSSGTRQHRGVQEHVLPTIFRRDETEATHLVEPLHGAVERIDRAGALIEIAARRTTVRAEATRTRRPEAAAAAATAATGRAAEVTTRRTVTEATTHATGRRATEVTPGRTIAEATATAHATARRTTEIAPGRTIAEATATAHATARWTTEVTPRRPVAKTTARRACAHTAPMAAPMAATLAAARASLEFRDARDEAPTLPIGTDFAHQNVVGIGLVDPRIRQCRCVEEHILPVRPEHKAEALAPIIPFHLGLDQASIAARGRIIVRHVAIQSTLVFPAKRECWQAEPER